MVISKKATEINKYLTLVPTDEIKMQIKKV